MFRVIRIFFSPTHGTQGIVAAVSDPLAGDEVEITDIDLTVQRTIPRHILVEADLAIIGVPVYFGRVARVAAQRLDVIRAQGIPAALLVTYGNRAYEDALLELYDLARGSGFIPFAAGAFVAEHAYSCSEYPIARKRPDEEDVEAARLFGSHLHDLLGDLGDSAELILPGSRPYREYPPPSRIVPVSLEHGCDNCGICIQVCPTGAIRFGRPVVTDPDKCIQCSACVKVCGEKKRLWLDPRIEETRRWLVEHCSVRKDPDLFFLTREVE